MSTTIYRKDIQALRGIAVLAVVLFHAKKNYFPLGYLGVDVFFVISGFVVIPLILRIFTDKNTNGQGNFSNLLYFYKRRFYRLAPALAVTLTFSAIVVFLLAPIDDHQRFARQGIATLLLGGNIGAPLYSGDYFSPAPNPLIHTWSLSVEEQIFLFLPLALMLIIRKRTNLKRVTSLVLIFITILSFTLFQFSTILEPLYSRLANGAENTYSFYSPISRVWQFTLGSLGFIITSGYKKYIRKFSKVINLAIVISLTMILFFPVQLNLKTSSIFASFATLIVIVCRSLDALPNWLSHMLNWFGDRSYSIYLIHMPLLYIAKHSDITRIGNSEIRIVQTVIAVIATLGFGAISYSKIEKKYRFMANNRTTGFNAIAVTMLLTFVIPLAIFVVMDRGTTSKYWGLDKNISQPNYAGYLDQYCARDSEKGPPCFYKNVRATKTVLLIGDSHAGHMSQAVVDSALNKNWNTVVWAHGGCKIQFESTVSPQVSANCLTINLKMKSWVLQHKPEAIIVSQFIRSNSSKNDLRGALLELSAITPNILLIANNPIFPDNPFTRPIISMLLQTMPAKMVSESSMTNEDVKASNQLSAWAIINGISVLNPTNLFCKNSMCTRYSDAGWLYRDPDHFSVTGAALLIPQLENFLSGL